MMTEEVCPICTSPLAGTISPLECQTCLSWLCLPGLDAQEQITLHKSSDYYNSSHYKKRRHETSIEKRCRSPFQRIEKSIPVATCKGKKILDIGCHTGTFLEVAQRLLDVRRQSFDDIAVALPMRLGNLLILSSVKTY